MTKGIRVVQVYPDTPAQKAGILAGDLLFRMDGQIINAYRTEDAEIFGNMIKEYKTDATVRFTGLRKRKPWTSTSLSKSGPRQTNSRNTRKKPLSSRCGNFLSGTG